MKVAYFDCQFGAAGDMLLGALLQSGLPQQAWQDALAGIALPAGSYRLSITDTSRGTIAAKKLDVFCEDAQPERHLSEVQEIIGRSAIAEKAKALSGRIFARLAAAEARVHGVTPQEVHFHEVGAIDAIIDILGFSIAFDMLGIEKSYVSALAAGGGVAQMEHGLFPVPGPAVVNLIQDAGAPVRTTPIDFECLTPTGAAILTTIADGWGGLPALDHIYGIGYGAGDKDPHGWPNVTRVILGEQAVNGITGFDVEAAQMVEANIDDSTPQVLSFTMERLLAAGALDVTVSPAVMKKGRSGHILSVVCRTEDKQKICELILRQTTSIGVRSYPVERALARRQWQVVQLPCGPVRIKIARDTRGNVINAQPEFEDCAQYALAHDLPLKEVLAQALSQFRLSN